jgi:hypothetical protein
VQAKFLRPGIRTTLGFVGWGGVSFFELELVLRVSVSCFLFTDTVSLMCVLFTDTVSVNNLFLREKALNLDIIFMIFSPLPHLVSCPDS